MAGQREPATMIGTRPTSVHGRTHLENNHCSWRPTIESTPLPLVGPFGFVAAPSVLRRMPRVTVTWGNGVTRKLYIPASDRQGGLEIELGMLFTLDD